VVDWGGKMSVRHGRDLETATAGGNRNDLKYPSPHFPYRRSRATAIIPPGQNEKAARFA